jgi:hypothetical protein
VLLLLVALYNINVDEAAASVQPKIRRRLL